jgi:hypothetical protein
MQIKYLTVKLLSVYKRSNHPYEVRVEMTDYSKTIIYFQQSYWPKELKTYLSARIEAPIFLALEMDEKASSYLKEESSIYRLTKEQLSISMKKYHHIEVTGFTSGLGYFKITYYPGKQNLIVESRDFIGSSFKTNTHRYYTGLNAKNYQLMLSDKQQKNRAKINNNSPEIVALKKLRRRGRHKSNVLDQILKYEQIKLENNLHKRLYKTNSVDRFILMHIKTYLKKYHLVHKPHRYFYERDFTVKFDLSIPLSDCPQLSKISRQHINFLLDEHDKINEYYVSKYLVYQKVFAQGVKNQWLMMEDDSFKVYRSQEPLIDYSSQESLVEDKPLVEDSHDDDHFWGLLCAPLGYIEFQSWFKQEHIQTVLNQEHEYDYFTCAWELFILHYQEQGYSTAQEWKYADIREPVLILFKNYLVDLSPSALDKRVRV